jgi:hypothetical protein
MDGKPRLPHFTLHHDAFGRLVLTDDPGRVFPAVEVVRAFPISDPRRCISVCDAEGHELIWIDELDAVPEPTRRVIEEELARREFVPVVRRILRVSAPVEPSEWDVETDRGRTHFVVNSEDDVRRLDGRRAMIIDANGVRYLIPDTRALDAGSGRLLERYL